MTILESILYGLISGLSEFLPASSQGLQAVLLRLFGIENREPLRDLLIHIAVLLALLLACRPMMLRVKVEKRIADRRRRRGPDSKAAYETRLIRTAGIPLAAGLLFYVATASLERSMSILALTFLINGIVVIVPEYIRHGNKDARFLTGFDGILLGMLGALSVFPGISRIGVMNGYILARGGDRSQGLTWLFRLSIPVLIVFVCLDIYGLFLYGFGITSFLTFIGFLLSSISAFFGAYSSIIIARNLAVKTGFAGFAYFSWGMAIFSFILYLIA